ncbi:hypothetical protein FAM09_16680 [Niastella caeni]|uniref:Uncharacterized protein n=1 Tax=Niastella caeni TaxID=2569763 RepID=A0A4S8HTF4_9BACT|nr:hypothetical protein [Niastella caeni]THU38311.1 hypothetical protein FAM09_16680 [Niastella caeni]
MIEIKLLDFIRDKQFGPIKLGDPKQKVIDALGEPDGYSNPDFNPVNNDAILYDRFEFNFRNNHLHSISNGYVLDLRTWKFNRTFHYQNDRFKFTSWFKKTWIDTRLENFKRKLNEEGIHFKEEAFFDAMKLTVGEDFELLFSSEGSYHKEPGEWQKIHPEILNLRFSQFFHFLPNK